MRQTFFTRQEAHAKIGNPVEAAADFPSVPKGRRGKVVDVRRRHRDAWIAVVEWESLQEKSHYFTMLGDVSLNFSWRRNPITDQFTKSEYETLLKA